MATSTPNLRHAVHTLPIAVYSGALDWSDTFKVNKFGHNLDIDTATDPEDVWTFGGTYTYQSTGVTVYASSSSAADTVVVQVEGLDENWDRQSESVTLNGTAQAEVPGTWRRVFRAYNDGGSEFEGAVYIAESDTLTAGVPDTASKVKAVIEAYDQQTQMALYTIPAGYTGFIMDWYATVLGGNNSDADVDLATRLQGGVFRTKESAGLGYQGSSAFFHAYQLPADYPAKTDIRLRCREVGFNDSKIIGGFTILCVRNG